MSVWDLVFYETPSGRCPVRDYLDSLSATEAAKVLADLDLLAEFGMELGMPSSEISLAERRYADYQARYSP